MDPWAIESRTSGIGDDNLSLLAHVLKPPKQRVGVHHLAVPPPVLHRVQRNQQFSVQEPLRRDPWTAPYSCAFLRIVHSAAPMPDPRSHQPCATGDLPSPTTPWERAQTGAIVGSDFRATVSPGYDLSIPQEF